MCIRDRICMIRRSFYGRPPHSPDTPLPRTEPHFPDTPAPGPGRIFQTDASPGWAAFSRQTHHRAGPHFHRHITGPPDQPSRGAVSRNPDKEHHGHQRAHGEGGGYICLLYTSCAAFWRTKKYRRTGPGPWAIFRVLYGFLRIAQPDHFKP